MISIQNLSFHFGGRALYENAAWHIKPKDKIGLIGANGTGKSTLLKLINGDYLPDEGLISKSNDCTIGYLNQDLLSYQSEKSILEVTLEAFEEANKLLHDINLLLQKLETDYSDEIINKLAEKQQRYEVLGGYSNQAKAEEILEGLGFPTEGLQKPLKEYSGGWRMRVMLAKILLAAPSLLMLDEPTNHLDLPSIEWLENYIKNYEGAVIVVSHDRQFLNNTCKVIAEVEFKKLNLYVGDYDTYLEEKELRSELQHNAFVNQQKALKQTEEFINRFKAKASKARQVQSKVKALEKIDKIEDVQSSQAPINFHFEFNKQPGKVILSLDKVSKSYGDIDILKNTSSTILRGDKIALIGANGKGKSTLLRIIAGTEKIEGNREPGHNVIEAFFAQHQLEALNLDNHLVGELQETGADKTELELRKLLGCFLFSDDDVFKKVKVLSGGEKSRLALAKTILSEANFLLLDEPTNHLDMLSVNMLIQALQQYQGSFVVVSHDRHFVKNIANKIWYIEDYEIKEYPGTYDEYLYWRSLQKPQAAASTKAAPQAKVKKQEYISPSEENRLKKELMASQKEVKKIEQDIETLEQEKQTLENEMAKPETYGNPDKLAEYSIKLNNVEQQLQQKTNDWEHHMEVIEKLEQNVAK